MIKNVITKGQQFFKIHWKKCTFALSVIALLTFLFWYGGDGKNSRGWNVNKEQTTVDLNMETSSNQSTQSTNKVANDTSSTENNTEVIETTKQDSADINNENSNVSGKEDTQDLVDPNNHDQTNLVKNEQTDQHIQQNDN